MNIEDLDWEWDSLTKCYRASFTHAGMPVVDFYLEKITHNDQHSHAELQMYNGKGKLTYTTVELKEVYNKLEEERGLDKLLNDFNHSVLLCPDDIRSIIHDHKDIIQQILEEQDV